MAVETAIHPPRTMLEVFKSLPEGTNIQLIENNLVMSPAPIPLHQWIIGEIFGELRSFFRKEKNGRVWISPSDLHLDDFNVYQPDLFVVLGTPPQRPGRKMEHRGILDLIVEVLSPSTARYDLHEKKEVYESFGVKEYWIINPEDYTATGYYLVNDEYHEFFKGEGVLESKLLNVKIEF